MQKFETPLKSHILYHATYKAHLASIMQWGLGGAPEMPAANYEDSKKGMVYLATTSDTAVSYAETSDVVPEDWLDEIVVLCVDCSKLDMTFLLGDENVFLNDGQVGDTLQYSGIISPAALSMETPDIYVDEGNPRC